MQTDQVASPAPPYPVFYPPLPSRAERGIVIGSQGSGSATIYVGPGKPRIVCESGLEMKAALVLLADPDIVDIQEQSKKIEYRDDDGEWALHWPDFLVTHSDGTKTAILVKPLARSTKAQRQAELLADQAPRGYADRFVVMTSADLDRTAVHDAALIHDMRRHVDPDADRAVQTLVDDLYGATTIRGLVDASGCGALGFGAVIRLIGNGVLRKQLNRRLAYASVVVRVQAPASRRAVR